MQKLIVARHGDSGGKNAELIPEGRAQIAQLAQRLVPIVVGSVAMISSSSKRGQESAEILVETLKCPVSYHAILYHDSLHSGGSSEDIAELVEHESKGINTLIIMGHQDHGTRLAGYLCERVFKSNIQTLGFMGYGEACVLDFDRKSYELLQQL